MPSKRHRCERNLAANRGPYKGCWKELGRSAADTTIAAAVSPRIGVMDSRRSIVYGDASSRGNRRGRLHGRALSYAELALIESALSWNALFSRQALHHQTNCGVHSFDAAAPLCRSDVRSIRTNGHGDALAARLSTLCFGHSGRRLRVCRLPARSRAQSLQRHCRPK